MSRKHRRDRQLWIMEIKSHYGCAHCDEDEICCLTFHHIDAQSKNRKICKCLSNFSKKLIAHEVNLCIVLCFNCHAKVEKGLITVDLSKRCYLNDKFKIEKYRPPNRRPQPPRGEECDS